MNSNFRLKKRATCGLIVTHQCNLNCRYCYVARKTDNNMPVETAKSIIESFLKTKRSEGCDELVFSFMGGEPFLRFDLMREVTDWLFSRTLPLPALVTATTNGTLLTPERQEWIFRYRKIFFVSLSYDGTFQAQNINRSSSASAIDLDFFLKCYEKPEIKATVSEESVPFLADGIIELTERGFVANANVAHGTRPWRRETFAEFARQLDRLVDYYLNNPDKEATSLVKIPLFGAATSKNSPRRRCGAGTESYVVYDCDGKAYPCHMFSPLTQSKSKLLLARNIDFLSEATFQNPACGNCALQPICPTCYGLNFRRTGDPARKEPYYCRVFRLQVIAACRYYSALFERKPSDALSSDEKRIAKVVNEILSPLLAAERGNDEF